MEGCTNARYWAKSEKARVAKHRPSAAIGKALQSLAHLLHQRAGGEAVNVGDMDHSLRQSTYLHLFEA